MGGESRFRIKPFLNFKMGKDQPKTEKKAAIKQVDEIVEGTGKVTGAVVGGVGGAAGGAIIGTVVCPGLGTAIGAGVGALATGAAGKAIGGFAGKVVTGSRKIVTKVGREAHLLPKKDSEKATPTNDRRGGGNHAAIEASNANATQPHRPAPPVPATAPSLPIAGSAPPPYEAYADPNQAPPPYSYTVTTTVTPSAPPSGQHGPPQHGPPQPAPRSNNLYPSLN